MSTVISVRLVGWRYLRRAASRSWTTPARRTCSPSSSSRSASTRQVGALDCSSYYWRDVTVFLVYSTMFILVSRSMYQNNNTSLCVWWHHYDLRTLGTRVRWWRVACGDANVCICCADRSWYERGVRHRSTLWHGSRPKSPAGPARVRTYGEWAPADEWTHCSVL